LNRNSIAKNIGLDNKTIQHYLNILHETGLIELIHENKSGSNLLKQTEKMYLDNPDLYTSITNEIGHESKIGTIREIFFIKMIKNSGSKIFYSKIGDFEINNIIFEIGGKNKTLKQIKTNLANAYLVKDNILYGSKYEIPLYLFGFLY
ncbi:MAG: ATPase, partial [Spirochaetota bacterium]|nr:ATPase [Spirochaetota bacterium]